MTDARALEERLAAAYAAVPSDGFAVADRRVAALTAGAGASPSRRQWRGLRIALAVAAALLVLAGATVAAVRLIEIVASATPGTSVALDQGVAFNERQVHGDYAITLERGYADINQVVIALSIERFDGGPVEVDMSADLVDPAGMVLPPGGTPGFGVVGAIGVAEALSFAPATASNGDYTLRVSTGSDGPVWTYRFQLPAPVGTVVEVNTTIEHSGASVSVGEVRLSPTMVSASIRLQSVEPDVFHWVASGYFRHDDRTIDLAWETPSLAWETPSSLSGMDQVATVEGVDPAEGEWTLVITEVIGERPDETQVRLHGPWEFAFDVP